MPPRAYRSGWDKALARAHIQEQAGKHFSLDITEEFMRMLDASQTGDLTVST